MDRLTKKGLPLLMPARVIRVKTQTQMSRLQLVRIFLSILIAAYFAPFILFGGTPVHAIGTTSASALVFEEARTSSPLSFTKKSPHSAQGDPCLSLLRSARLSPGAQARGSSRSGRSQSLSPYEATDKQAASVALGFFLGVRVALGPKEVVKDSERVQIGPEIRATSIGSNNYALAIASYRSCKNNYVLGLRQKNNNK
jgi:hypothetical protein